MGGICCRVAAVAGLAVMAGWVTPAVSGDGPLEGKFLCHATSFTYFDDQHRRHDEKDSLPAGREPFLIWLKEAGIFHSVGKEWRRIFTITQSNRAGKPAIVGLDSKASSLDWFRLTEVRADEFRFANGLVSADWAEGRPVTMISGTCRSQE
jgi:hypothetical protein